MYILGEATFSESWCNHRMWLIVQPSGKGICPLLSDMEAKKLFLLELQLMAHDNGCSRIDMYYDNFWLMIIGGGEG